MTNFITMIVRIETNCCKNFTHKKVIFSIQEYDVSNKAKYWEKINRKYNNSSEYETLSAVS